MSKRVKDAFLGEDGTVLAGGSCPHAAPKPALKQKDVEVEPACWFSMPECWYLELLHSFELGGLVECNPLDVYCPIACIKQKIPYVGLALTDALAQALEKQLTKILWNSYQDPNSPVYEAGLATLLGGSRGTKRPGGEDGQDPATKKRGKGNAKGGKAKGGKGKKKRRNEGETETSAAGSAGKGRKKGAGTAEATNGGQPAAGETAADILRKLQNMQGGEGA